LNDHSLEKIISNTWFVNGKTFVANEWINQIYLSYHKPSFDSGVYNIQFLTRSQLLEGPKWESQTEYSENKKSWGMFPGS
jgi:hypothetical protein